MDVRTTLNEKKQLSTVAAVGFVLLGAIVLAYQFWPQKKANLGQTYFTDDDGKTWFADSSYRVAPFDHNGKTAVIAEIYNYDSGSKTFCAYLAKYTPEAKKRLEAALADAQAKGQPPSSVTLYHDHGFIQSGMMVKLPGSNNSWLPYSDPGANDVFSIHSPDGSVVDQVFVY
jgi:hypothetical protein